MLRINWCWTDPIGVGPAGAAVSLISPRRPVAECSATCCPGEAVRRLLARRSSVRPVVDRVGVGAGLPPVSDRVGLARVGFPNGGSARAGSRAGSAMKRSLLEGKVGLGAPGMGPGALQSEHRRVRRRNGAHAHRTAPRWSERRGPASGMTHVSCLKVERMTNDAMSEGRLAQSLDIARFIAR